MVMYLNGFYIKRCRDNGIKLVFFFFNLKISNIFEYLVNDFGEVGIRNLEEIF